MSKQPVFNLDPEPRFELEEVQVQVVLTADTYVAFLIEVDRCIRCLGELDGINRYHYDYERVWRAGVPAPLVAFAVVEGLVESCR